MEKHLEVKAKPLTVKALMQNNSSYLLGLKSHCHPLLSPMSPLNNPMPMALTIFWHVAFNESIAFTTSFNP